MSSLVFLKLGGSAITDKTREAAAKPDVIRGAARAVRAAMDETPSLQLVLGHGSGSFGHFSAIKWGFGQPDNWRAFAETGASAQRLNRLVTDIFLEEKVPVLSLQPSASARARDGVLHHFAYANLQTALEHGLVPLVYGDVAFDDAKQMTIVSTDALFAFLALLLRPRRIIHATAVGGVFTADPLIHPDAALIPRITPKSFQALRATVGSAHGLDVTGGMLDKLRKSVALVEQVPGLEVQIISCEPPAIYAAVRGELVPSATEIAAD